MRHLIAAASAAIVLAFAGAASAAIAVFEAVDPGPSVYVDPANDPLYKPGAFSIDTIGAVNVLFRWQMDATFDFPQYDNLRALAALGDLPGVLTIDGNPTLLHGRRNSLASGTFRIMYSGADITVNGETFTAGDDLLSGFFRYTDPYQSAFSSDFFRFPAHLAYITLDYRNVTPVGDGWQANVAGSVAVPLPEPTTWAMMIIGFGLSGVMLRRPASRPLVLRRPLPN